MAKGIRVSQLAKELGVPSKAVLDKCRDEGLAEKVPNHMSVLSIGLTETVREWFHGQGGVSTAVETAPRVEVAVKPKTTRSRKKAEVLTAEAPPAEPIAPPEQIAEVTARKPARPRRAPKTGEAAGAPPAAPVTGTGVPDFSRIESPIRPAPAPAAPPPVPHTPIARAAEVSPPIVVPRQPPQPGPPPPPADQPRVARPTITLANRAGGSVIERKAVKPAPKLNVPEPAKIQGPRVVREEKPDVVPTPRPRRPGGAGAQDSPAFTQARPMAGRGVKPTDEEEDSETKKKAAAKGKSLSSRRRGPDGRRGEAEEKLREFTEADLIERRDRLNAAASFRTGFDRHLDQSQRRGHHVQAKTAVQKGEPVEIEEPITVKGLSAVLGIKSNDIIGRLMKQNVFASVNQTIGRDVAEAISLEYGVELRIKQESTLDELLETEFESREAKAEDLVPRPPVVTILGHVDHGKTSLLDRIRKANVAAGEAGGITQHTAAWMVQLGDKKVTFIDTPGHQAFTSMRARGANMTDVVVLVVSAAEGVQPQTVESINHARAAEVPIVVAMNKIDRPDANPDMVLGQLAGQGLNPVEWGGDIEVVRTSATTGTGIEELIEILHYQAELLELKADPTAPARGVVIESRMQEGLGSVATVLVQDGTLKVGDMILSGPAYGRIRALMDDRGQSIEEATPAMPVIVSGLNDLPDAGDKFHVTDDRDRARDIAEERQTRSRQSQLATKGQVTLDSILASMKATDVKTINLIIKADVQGSVETLVKTVTDSNTEEVKVKVIHSGVGAINESDVELAIATKAKPTDNRVAIIGFHVVPDEAARALAEHHHIDMKLYRVIYEIFDDLKKSLSGMLEPEVREKLHGHAEIRQVFKVSRVGNIAGCLVTDGHIQRGSKMRLIRNGAVITEDLSLESLKRIKEDAREVKAGLECGIKLAGYDDIKVGDVLEAYVRETFQRTL